MMRSLLFRTSVLRGSTRFTLCNAASSVSRQAPPNAVSEQKEVLTHVNKRGKVKMVDISSKKDSYRVAIAAGRIYVGPELIEQVERNEAKKGDVLTVARLAGICAAKQTHSLIPLCHAIPISNVRVKVKKNVQEHCFDIEAFACAVYKTGVEMEALTAVSVCALTIYDMLKAFKGHQMRIENIRLLAKEKRPVDTNQ